jgi:nucleotide-binding universal stress UspA family protein
MTQILAVIDGSIYSTSVCDHAAWIAQRLQLSVEVVHVLGRRDVSSQPTNLSGSIGLGARTELLDELAELDASRARLAQKRGRAILEDAKERLNADGVTEVATRLRHGEIVETVQDFETDAEVIVIGKRGEAADFNSLHLGSNLERIVRSTHKPIFVASREFKPIKRFLLAFDGGNSATLAVERLAALPQFADLTCQLLYVGNASTELQRQLEGAQATLQQAGFTVEAEVIPGQAEAVIADRVESDHIDLLVMGAYGHSRIRNLIIGSTTTHMLQLCRVPVILFR